MLIFKHHLKFWAKETFLVARVFTIFFQGSASMKLSRLPPSYGNFHIFHGENMGQ